MGDRFSLYGSFMFLFIEYVLTDMQKQMTSAQSDHKLSYLSIFIRAPCSLVFLYYLVQHYNKGFIENRI